MSWGKLLEGLWTSSMSAAVIILAVLLLRAAFQGRTPRRIFCLLWDMALARLLILTALPSPISIWQWLPATSAAQIAEEGFVATARPAVSGAEVMEDTAAVTASMAAPSAQPVADESAVLAAIWLAVGLLLAAWFLWSHLRSRRRYADSLPCGDDFVRDWLASHRLLRRIQVRTSDRIAAPLTYGVLRPVVLLPSGMDWTDRTALRCILEHEFQHIRRFDTLRKALLASALCLHWFNPLVWAAYVLSNRDMELACDEAVTARSADRAGYARTLLNMEQQRGQWGLSGSHFSQNALEERIRCIMKHKKTSIAALAAILVIMSITITVFASTVPKNGSDAPHFQALENDVMILSNEKSGEREFSVDGGKTWMSEARYHAQYGDSGDVWQVEWWSAEEYAAWLEEEKQTLQEMIGERGYTGSEGWFTWDQQRVDETIALYESILEDIKNGALYSKTITDANGNTVEAAALASDGPIDQFVTETFDRAALAASVSPLDEDVLLEELKAFGIGGDANRMTYNGKRIRCFVDGVAVGESGYSIRYVCTNPEGVVDVHTLRSVIRNPDGSYDPMGELIGVAAEGEPGFDQSLIDCATASDGIQAAAEAETDIEDDIGGKLEPYEAFGLRYAYELDQNGEMRLRMSWNGKPVHSLWDTETGTWFANNMHGTELSEDAVDLETVYRDGKLCGLQESQPPHEVIHGIEATAASGSSAEGGTTFEEIFAQYQSYGLTYSSRQSGMGSLTWNNQTVKSFSDLKPNGGAFSYEDPLAENGLRVQTQYDADGNLTGLRAEKYNP